MGRVTAWLGRLLNAVPPEEMGGLRLEGPCWEVATRRIDQAEFFRALTTLVPEGCFLVLEGGSHALHDLLGPSAVTPHAKIARGTLWPRATVLHVPTTVGILGQLAEVAEHCAAPELCDHLHVYDREGVLVQWYDAFSDPVYVSKRVPVERLEVFCRSLNTSFKEVAKA